MRRIRPGWRKALGSALRGFAWILSATLSAAVVAVSAAYFREHREWKVPLPALHASDDSVAIERGRYLVNGPGHCADCHAPPEWRSRVEMGEEAPLSGGHGLRIFLGRMRYPNITPDSESGIGRVSDGELARFFRYGVNRFGEVGLPFMDYADLSDSDLGAIMSYLRHVPAVRHSVPASRYNLLGKITKAYFLEPFETRPEPVEAPARGRTAEYGGYLANSVSSCASCHTARNMNTGEYTGPRFAGGMVFHKQGDASQAAVSPNLTPDAETGAIAAWDEEAFIRRFRIGNPREWSPMPWGPFSRMTDDDLGAIFLYLSSLQPVHRRSYPAPE